MSGSITSRQSVSVLTPTPTPMHAWTVAPPTPTSTYGMATTRLPALRAETHPGVHIGTPNSRTVEGGGGQNRRRWNNTLLVEPLNRSIPLSTDHSPPTRSPPLPFWDIRLHMPSDLFEPQRDRPGRRLAALCRGG